MLKLMESSPILAVSLQKIKTHLRIDHSEDDTHLKLLIGAATTLVEQEIGQSLLTKIWKKHTTTEITKEGLGRISLPYPPLIQVISVGEILGGTKVKPIRRYIVEWEHTIPTLLVASGAKKFEVVYQAGFGEKPSSIPTPLRQAILMLVADMYEKRMTESCIAENSLVKVLLNPFCINRLI